MKGEQLAPNHWAEQFPDRWMCAYCLGENNIVQWVKKDDIIAHVVAQHSHECNQKGLTWEILYKRMIQVGGL